MTRRLAVLSAVVALLIAGACGSDDKKAATIAVRVDGRVSGLTASFNAYFPNTVTAHAGDTIRFTSTFTGAPHTVTLGTAVDKALKAADTAGQTAPELAALPNFNPPAGGDPLPIAAEPCSTTSAPPLTGACPTKDSLPNFNGKQVYYNSGWLPDKATFPLTLDTKIAPGSYRYFCLIHRLNMEGTITVVDKDTKLPDHATVAKKADGELSTLAKGLKDAVAAAKPPAGANVQAGVGSPTIKNAAADEFAPTQVSVPVNSAVVWSFRGRHTVSFNAPSASHLGLTKASDGSVHANAAANSPVGGPGQTAGATAIDGGSWDGTGVRSSGVISAQAAPATYKLTFTKAGSYTYECLLHPGMAGTVTVT